MRAPMMLAQAVCTTSRALSVANKPAAVQADDKEESTHLSQVRYCESTHVVTARRHRMLAQVCSRQGARARAREHGSRRLPLASPCGVPLPQHGEDRRLPQTSANMCCAAVQVLTWREMGASQGRPRATAHHVCDPRLLAAPGAACP